MTESITITLPTDVKQALDDMACREGVSQNEIVERAIRAQLFLQRFHTLRERMAAHAGLQGLVTDEDVFDRVS